MYVVDSLTLNSPPAALQLIPGWSLFDTYLLQKAQHSILVLGTTRRHFSTTLGVILKSKIANGNQKHMKNMALSQKGHKFTIWGLK